MKLEIDLDELYAEGRGHTPADIVRDEVERRIREAVQKAVAAEIALARDKIEVILHDRLRIAVLLAAKEIEETDDDELIGHII